MTPSVSSAEAATLLPVGQPLGKVIEPDGAAYYQVRLGTQVFRLEMREAVVWLALHAHRPGSTRGIDRGLLHQLDLADRGVSDPTEDLELLLDLGLVVELDLADDATRRTFAESFRMVALQTVLGNTEQDLDAFTLIAGSQPTVRVDAAIRDVVTHSVRHFDLHGACYVRSGSLGAWPDTAALSDPDTLLEHVTRHLPMLLAVNAVYLDVTVDPTAARSAYEASQDRAVTMPTTDDDTTAYGLYAVGYPAGARYVSLGLESVNVRLGGQELELASAEAWIAWSAAHGVADGDGVDDSEEAIVQSARSAGAPAPVHDLDEQTTRGLIAQPDGDRELVAFAAGHRLEALMAGLGNTTDDPQQYWLGVNDDNLITKVPAAAYDIWRAAPLSWTLLDAAHAADRAGSVAQLREYLGDVQLLCLRRAAYIDRVRTA